ncbi:hypothetical protein [Capnocytophaga stomatis]|uniref:Uncharacterized protein n=1 Tax=Capnocytophaga stomatis TaxID=1848904 RepID=A0ABW8QB48_9FLAO|nr:hypothetical protein [Capnocytophaga stomatis]
MAKRQATKIMKPHHRSKVQGVKRKIQEDKYRKTFNREDAPLKVYSK